MAGYDPEQDRKIAEWKNEETGLIISIMQYGTGEPKLQVGPRILKKKDGSDRAPMKAGRLSVEDVMWLYDIIDEIKDELSDMVGPE
ncbi:hypothetical protein [uncultured Desulfobacter sp.]|uniref:hypothetical protein n=1 Tax=uncultured Desulfobacter sp. TaxID=240139 RepID=UPI002AABE73A|nr:hypothetical protein [uncultured Desulfobacter sp.]